MFKEYDVIVVGAGHAGCEAAAANMGSSVLLVTMNMQTIAQMSYLRPIFLTLLVLIFSTNWNGGLVGQNNNSDANVSPHYSSFTDTRDGKTYKTVLIGTQWWMAENLNYSTSGTFINGEIDQTDNGTIEKYCYNNDSSFCAIYGGLYQWAEAVQYTNGASNITSPVSALPINLQGVCPSGWHLPTDAEWFTVWHFPTDAGWATIENTVDFTALPGGYRESGGSFYLVGDSGFWWSATEGGATSGWTRDLLYPEASVNRYNNSKAYGFSVRCVKD